MKQRPSAHRRYPNRKLLMARKLDRALSERVSAQLKSKAITVTTSTLVDATIMVSASEGDDDDARWKVRGANSSCGFFFATRRAKRASTRSGRDTIASCCYEYHVDHVTAGTFTRSAEKHYFDSAPAGTLVHGPWVKRLPGRRCRHSRAAFGREGLGGLEPWLWSAAMRFSRVDKGSVGLKEAPCEAFCGDLKLTDVPVGYPFTTAFRRDDGASVTFYLVHDKARPGVFRIEDDGTSMPFLVT